MGLNEISPPPRPGWKPPPPPIPRLPQDLKYLRSYLPHTLEGLPIKEFGGYAPTRKWFNLSNIFNKNART